MKVYTEIIYHWNGTELELVSEKGFEYDSPVALCKGSDTADKQLALQNQIEQTALTRQYSVQDKINAAMTPLLSGQIGYSPQQLAIAKTQALNQNSQNFGQAATNLNAMLQSRGARGGNMPQGGDAVRATASLLGAQASDKSNQLNTLNLSNLQQMINNQSNASNAMLGLASQAAPVIGASSGAASDAMNQSVWAQNQGFGNAFMSNLGASMGKGLGSSAATGISSLGNAYVPNAYFGG